MITLLEAQELSKTVLLADKQSVDESQILEMKEHTHKEYQNTTNNDP